MAILSSTLSLITRARRKGRAAITRILAGQPLGLPARARRGTVLVLILGALALISVITLIYTAIGQADKRASTSTQVKADVSGTVTRIGDYFRGVIGDGTFTLNVDGVNDPTSNNAVPVWVRPAFDYPFTDPYRESIVLNPPANPNVDSKRFDPTGSFTLLFGSNLLDTRQPSTPFLASTEPTWIRTGAVGQPIPVPQQQYKMRRDWMHITNMAPDGRFVNLANLRNHFDAYSVRPNTNGVPQAPWTVNGVEQAEMGYGLVLRDATGRPTKNLETGNPANANIPAHWANRQRLAFAPASGPMYYPAGSATDPADPPGVTDPNSPGSYWFAPYQWADADGDGFFDSRWFELVDATDRDNPLSILAADTRFRWFVAARVVDLNAMVDVNAATDFRSPPRATIDPNTNGAFPAGSEPLLPLGVRPGDIDLRRLLTLDDVGHRWNFAYDALRAGQPGSPDDYTQYLWGALSTNVGDRAYEALRLVLLRNSEQVPPAGAALNAAPFGPVPIMNADQRAAYYEGFGALTQANYFINAAAGNSRTFETVARFGAADLLELMTYRGINNPLTTSRLEQALDGRYDQVNGGSAADAVFGPLRSNRTLSVERAPDIDENNGLGDGAPDLKALAMQAADPRQRITPISGARPLASNVLTVTQNAGTFTSATKNVLDPTKDLRADARAALKAATNQTLAQRDPSKLFNTYASALLPHAARKNAWKDPQLRTLFYGYNPELALRIAAHMTVNAMDAFDKATLNEDVSAPSAVTLLVDDSKRNQIPSIQQNGFPAFPWWNLPGNGTPPNVTFPGRLDLGTGNLPSTNNTDPIAASQGAVNVFGIEAQPVITQVVSMAIYVDSPQTALNTSGTGHDADDDYTIPTPPPPYHMVTIYTAIPTLNAAGQTVPPANADFLGEFVAFQLTNPFNEPIQLSEFNVDPYANNVAMTTNDYTSFYLDFANRHYKLAKIDTTNPGTPTLRTVVLYPGESRCFVAMNDTLEHLNLRWKQSENGRPTLPGVSPVLDFVTRQFGMPATAGRPIAQYPADEVEPATNTVRPILIPRLDKTSGANDFRPDDILETGNPEQVKVVHLWRTMRTQGMDQAPARNDVHNDMLVDRIRQPGGAINVNGNVLDRRLPRGPIQPLAITGTESADPASADPRDNTGLVVALWGSLSRHRDPHPAAGSVPLGAIPAYCVEAKWGTNVTNGPNLTDFTTLSPGRITGGIDCRLFYSVSGCGGRPFPVPPGMYNYNAAKDLLTFVNTFAVAGNAAGHIMVPSMTQNPRNWGGPTAGGGGGAPVSTPMPDNLDNPPRKYTSLYPQVHLNNLEYERTQNNQLISTLRVADMLLPLGLGPIQDPGAARTPNDFTDEPDLVPGWITLPEALALALNYSTPAATSQHYGIYAKAGDGLTGAFDRGNLCLDRFAPFEDMNPQNPIVFNPGVDPVRYPGFPLALSILDKFSTDDPQFGGLTRATPGRINLNTASPEVVALLPMLAPTTEVTTTGPFWQQKWRPQAGLPPTGGLITIPSPPTAPLAADGTDVASTLIALRDRTLSSDRDGWLIHFEDTVGADPFNPQVWNGRLLTTNIGGITEAPGLPSAAAMMTAIDRAGANGAPSTTRITIGADQIDHWGIEDPAHAGNEKNSSIPGLVSTLYHDLGQPITTGSASTKADTIPDDWFEKLQLAAGVVGSTTVRSDLFAVWFVVHGYQRSDVENLKNSDPLVPSVAKRYLMVVDRSNVTHKGDKPRVVLFQELPMN
jgi:hypothetical protein